MAAAQQVSDGCSANRARSGFSYCGVPAKLRAGNAGNEITAGDTSAMDDNYRHMENALLARVDERTRNIERQVDERTRIIERQIAATGGDLRNFMEHVSETYVTKSDMAPVRSVVYGLVALILIAVITAVISKTVSL